MRPPYAIAGAEFACRRVAFVFDGQKNILRRSKKMNPLRWILHFLFGCHHSHMSRIFTIKGRTYKVCFDCGEEFDLPDAQATKAA